MDITKETKIYKNFDAETKAVDDTSKRTFIVRISTPAVDRSGDVVMPLGMDATNFMKNPVVLFAHDYSELPIARCIDLQADDTGVLATVEFMPEGTYDKSDLVYNMIKLGFMNAWSIGFMPKTWTENETGYIYNTWEIYEFSAVPVPANQEALTIMRSKGIDTALLEVKEVEEVKKEPYTVDEVNETEEKDLNLDGKVEMSVAQYLELKQELIEAKSGRTISAKHEDLLKNACDQMGGAIGCIKGVLDTVAETAEPTKSAEMTPSLLERLSKQLKGTDKSVGLTLRLLKEIEQRNK